MANQNFKVKKGLEVGTALTATSDGLNVTGIITATQFNGDGSGLTGVTAAGSGVVVQEEGSSVGTAATINFIGSNVTAAISGGVASVTVTGGGDVVSDTTPQLGGNLDLNSKDITGTGNISITGGFNATGVSTFQDNVEFTSTASFGDSDKINLGTDNDLQIYHDGSNSYITDSGSGNLLIGSDNDLWITNAAGTENKARFTTNGGVNLYYDNSKKLETANTGVIFSESVGINTTLINPNLDAKFQVNGNLNVAGIATIRNIDGNTMPRFDIFAFNDVPAYALKTRAVGVGPEFDMGVGLQSVNFNLGCNNETGGNKGVMLWNGDSLNPYARASIINNSISSSHYVFRVSSGNGNGAKSEVLNIAADGSVHLRSDASKLKIGVGEDLQIYHDGTHSVIKDEVGIGLSIVGNTKVIGVLTATSFSGTLAASNLTGALPAISGSNLTGLTGASAATYGSATTSPQITVDSNGRITGISNVIISGGGGGGTSVILKQGGSLVGTAGTIDFGAGFSVSSPVAGVSTITRSNDFTGNVTITSTDAGSSAGPEFKLFRNSASPADADYIGQIKFAGESDTGVERNYAKITGKISDASNGTEDGIIEIAHIKDGSQNISARWTSTELKFLNGTDISMADGLKVLLGTGDDADIYHDGSDAYFTNSTGQLLVRGNDIKLQSSGGETYATFANNGAASLYHDNALKINTTSTGAVVTGILTATSFVKASNSGGFLKANGTEDTNTYLTAETDPVVAAINGLVKSNGTTISAASAGTDYLTPTGDGSGLTGIAVTASSNIQATWSVTANGSSAYRFTGPGNDGVDDNPDLYLVRGQRYRFTNNSGGSHPFQIRSTPGGSAYSAGVTNNGAASGNIEFSVQHDAPGTLFYQCTSHSGMVGKIIILGDAIIEGTWTASAGTAETIDSIIALSASTVEYTVYIENGTNRQAQKVLVMHDGTTAYYQEYAIMHKSGLLVSMSADINSGNIRLRATPETGISGSTTFRVTRKTMR